jgi:hypothetical protein
LPSEDIVASLHPGDEVVISQKQAQKVTHDAPSLLLGASASARDVELLFGEVDAGVTGGVELVGDVVGRGGQRGTLHAPMVIGLLGSAALTAALTAATDGSFVVPSSLTIRCS